MFLTSQFDLHWPTFVLELLNTQKQAVTSTDSVFSVDCYVATKNSGDPVNSYYYKLALIALLPLIIFIISFLIWLGICMTKETNSYLKRELPLTMIVVFFLVYPNIVVNSFNHFSCLKIDQMGSYLKINYAIECGSSQYLKYTFIVAIPSILVWTIGLPTCLLIVMAKRKRYLNRDNNRVIFGFIFNGYRKARFFWEFIIMYRKILIITIVVFFAQISVSVQALSIVLVMLASTLIHYLMDPYKTHELNHMEMEALITSTLTLYCGLYYLTDDIGTLFQIILFVVIILGNSYFVLYWLYWMIKAISDIIVKIFPVLRFLLKKGDAYEEEYFQEHISRPGTYFDQIEGIRLCTFLSKRKKNKFTGRLPFKSLNDVYIKTIEREYSEKRRTLANKTALIQSISVGDLQEPEEIEIQSRKENSNSYFPKIEDPSEAQIIRISREVSDSEYEGSDRRSVENDMSISVEDATSELLEAREKSLFIADDPI